jgi:cob(I)alamin adenosyltransferase
MKIYTKTGDKGTTSLFGGTRVSKGHDRINAYGTIDELNSYLGLLRDQEVNRPRVEFIAAIQENLFIIGSVLATEPGNTEVKIPALKPDSITVLETAMDEMDNLLPPMRNFILPGGHASVSFCHIARCVCRRAERLVVMLADNEPVEEKVIVYLNRLSDYLFVLARKMSTEIGAKEIPWISKG